MSNMRRTCIVPVASETVGDFTFLSTVTNPKVARARLREPGRQNFGRPHSQSHVQFASVHSQPAPTSRKHRRTGTNFSQRSLILYSLTSTQLLFSLPFYSSSSSDSPPSLPFLGVTGVSAGVDWAGLCCLFLLRVMPARSLFSFVAISSWLFMYC